MPVLVPLVWECSQHTAVRCSQPPCFSWGGPGGLARWSGQNKYLPKVHRGNGFGACAQRRRRDVTALGGSSGGVGMDGAADRRETRHADTWACAGRRRYMRGHGKPAYWNLRPCGGSCVAPLPAKPHRKRYRGGGQRNHKLEYTANPREYTK